MKNLTFSKISLSIAALVLLAVFGLAGCGGGGGGNASESNVLATRTIGSGGGSITTSDNKVTITIPTAALASDTTITVTQNDINMMQIGAIYNVAGTGGADLTFTQPVTVKLNYDPNLLPAGSSEENLQLAILNPLDGWETLPDSTVNTLNHSVTATTIHFSDIAVRPSYVAVSNPALGFPLLDSPNGNTPYNAQITSVFDHAMITKNCPGDGVRAYTGEKGTVLVPENIEPSGTPGKVCANLGLYGNLFSFYNADKTPFHINNYYKGTAGSGNTVLNYDGHAGIDYPVDYANVYAATSGTVSVDAKCWNTDGTAKNSYTENGISKPCYGSVMITYDNDPAYQTYYLHLSKKFKKGQEHINKGELLGISGNTSPTPVGKHLHFQVNKDVGKISTPVDPYGWDGTPGTDPYATQIGGIDSVKLWEVQSPTPTAPTSVSATAGNGQVTISWNAISGATSYNLYWSTSSGVTKTNGTKISNATSPYTHTGRTNGTTYYYVVTAVNSYGESIESSQASATTNGTGGVSYTW